MLLSFRVANHRSIKEEQQLLLGPVYEADRPEGTDWEAVPVVAVFGANAAGKSNVVDALRYMEHMVRSSHRDAEPGAGTERFAFALDEECRAEPSWFVVDLSLDGVRHTYGFSLDDERVVDEWLYSYPHGRKRIVFQRARRGLHLRRQTAPQGAGAGYEDHRAEHAVHVGRCQVPAGSGTSSVRVVHSRGVVP